MSSKDPEGAELEALARIVDVTGLRVLEIGCGDGRLTARVASAAASVLAIDPDEELIAEARRTLPAELAEKVRFEVADAVELQHPPRSFDLALLSWSL